MILHGWALLLWQPVEYLSYLPQRLEYDAVLLALFPTHYISVHEQYPPPEEGDCRLQTAVSAGGWGGGREGVREGGREGRRERGRE